MKRIFGFSLMGASVLAIALVGLGVTIGAYLWRGVDAPLVFYFVGCLLIAGGITARSYQP